MYDPPIFLIWVQLLMDPLTRLTPPPPLVLFFFSDDLMAVANGSRPILPSPVHFHHCTYHVSGSIGLFHWDTRSPFSLLFFSYPASLLLPLNSMYLL